MSINDPASYSSSDGIGSSSLAVPSPFTAALQVGSGLLQAGIALLAQHTARLKAATSENAAVQAVIPAFDRDIAEIVDAYNAGTYNDASIIQALQNVDAQMYQYLKSQVRLAGTAWDGSGKCTKTCTVGCCVFYNNLHSAIYGPDVAPYNGSIAAANGSTGLIPAVFAGGGTVSIPTIYPQSKYKLAGRPGYTVALSKPGFLTKPASQSAQDGLPLPNLPAGQVGTVTSDGRFSSLSGQYQNGLLRAGVFPSPLTVSAGAHKGAWLAALAVVIALGVVFSADL